MLRDTHYPVPSVAFVSPLTRACKTASLLFRNVGVPLVASEFIREKRTGLECDERSEATVASASFPDIDFSEIEALDAASDDGFVFREGLREGNAEVRARAARLLDFLAGQEASAIALVTHKGFLRELNEGTRATRPWPDTPPRIWITLNS